MKAAEPDLLLSPRGTPKPLPSAPDRDAAVVKHARLPNLRAVAKPPSPEPAVDKQVPRLKPRRVVASPTGAVPEPRTAPAEQPRSRPVEARPGAVKPLASSRDIDDLPSLGPALKAKLRRLNIKTIGELAKQSPDDLRSRLGPAGRLINMDLIIASARSQIK
jgi:predicted flap endonuclease-1-like 5' DNA nuclease